MVCGGGLKFSVISFFLFLEGEKEGVGQGRLSETKDGCRVER